MGHLKEMLEYGKRNADENLHAPDLIKDQSLYTFMALTSFLMDPKRFNRPPVNQLIRSMNTLIGDGVIKTEVQGEVEPSHGIYVRKALLQPIHIGIPFKYAEEVASNSITELGRLAHTASMTRDSFFNPQIELHSKLVLYRANAYYADTIIGLLDMAEKEKLTLNMTDYEKMIIAQYPYGARDIPEMP